MSTTLLNGVAHGRPHPQRKQLSDQLDRFDEILDGLADGLNEAIADAAREGARLAVKDVIVEILTNPDLRDAIHAIGPRPVTTEPTTVALPRSEWNQLNPVLRRFRAALAGSVHATRGWIKRWTAGAAVLGAGTGRGAAAAWRQKGAVVATAAVGMAIGAGAYYAAPHAGAVLSAAAGAFVAVRTAL
jgi:hypothetical protein